MADARQMLGVPEGADEAAVDRAYRLRVVATHRRGLWAMTARLAQLQRAYRTLRGDSRPRLPDARPRDVGLGPALALLLAHRRTIAEHSTRRGSVALQRTATWVEDLAREHDERERVHAIVLRRREAFARLRVALLLAVLVLAAVLAGAEYRLF